MGMKEVLSQAKGAVNRVGFQIREKSPAIFVVVGGVTGLAALVMAIKAGVDVHKKKEEWEAEDAINTPVSHEDEEDVEPVTLSPEVKARRVWELILTVLPAAGLELVSILSFVAAAGILKKREMAYAAAYMAAEEANRLSRKYIQDNDIQKLEGNVEEKAAADNEDEPEAEDSQLDPWRYSQYARIFDESNWKYSKEPNYNQAFIGSVLNTLNRQLRRDHYVFLNDAYELLGFEKTRAGQFVGWRYDPNNVIGDNCISFGLERPETRAFNNGQERSVILDFNVDGMIIDTAFKKDAWRVRGGEDVNV